MHSPEDIRRGLKISIFEGALAHVYANLTGGIFLPAFALILFASELQIGILAALPFFATIAQIFGSVMVERFGHRKTVAIFFALLSRLLWIPIVILVLQLFDQSRSLLLTLVILIVLIHHLLGALSGVAWLSWMSNLVPPMIRGRFFGLRNSVLGTITIGVTLAGGYFLDWFHLRFDNLSPSWPFVILFIIAIIAGVSSAILLIRQPDPGQQRRNSVFLPNLFKQPFQNDQFRLMLGFAMIWSFAVNFASPFFIVYMIKDLNFSYTLISLMTILAALADLSGMGFWGTFSDRHGNRPVILISALVGATLPFFWLFSDSSLWSVVFLVPLLHLAGGFFFAGYNLCSVNLLFNQVPRNNNSIYFALWSVINGFAAGLGAITAGFLYKHLDGLMAFIPLDIDSGFKIIFIISFLLRLAAVLMMRQISEPKGLPVIRAVRILRSVRVWATTMGYHPLLQFFLPYAKIKSSASSEGDYWPLWKRPDTRQV